MANFESVYNLIKDKDNIHKRDSGTLFEEIVKVYLQHDIKYKNVFKNVWLWSEFPNNTGSDTGIDIVAEDLNGGYVAVQCKFYAMDKKIDKKDLDSFLSESGKEGYVERIVVATTNNWTNNANNAVENQTIPVKRIGFSNFEDSNIDFLEYLNSRKIVDVLTKKTLREYQIEAIEKVKEGFRSSDRGKLIMACGTGKTFTSLKIMEELLKEKTKKEGARVLFLVPSLALLSQTHKEWSEQSAFNLKQLAVCSDSKIGKETEDYSLVDLEVSATTDSKTVIKHSNIKENEISVIYSTYHSLDVIYDSQQKGLDEFDLVICDEAHRTVGIKVGSEESYFTKIHDENYIKAKKRLYMTATPKIYSESIKKKGEENNIEMFSMDDEKNYGKEFYKLGFSEAVEKKLLTDYKVLVLAISEEYINATMQQSQSNKEGELKVDDTAKIVGCWNALSKRMDDFMENNNYPMQRAVAFCSTIKDSKHLSGDDDTKKNPENTGFKKVIEDYYKNSGESLGVKVEDVLNCKCQHVDGKMNSMERQEKLRWLKDENIEKNECRILFNARCLSEGVDVPTLDAVIFMQPRKSNIDIIQAVGRVMRRAKNKDWGYIILPIVVKAGVKPEDALNDNEAYSVVWDVLRALRSIDERLDITINSVEFKKNLAKHVDVIGVPGKEIVENKEQFVLNYGNVAEYKDAIYAKIVQKCGDRIYWDKWAKDVSDIAEKNILRINGLVDKNIEAREVFNTFLLGLHKNINSDIGRDEAIEMLAQHMITKPIFNAIFMDYDFAANNVISKEMQHIIDILEKNNLESENKSLATFYDSITKRVRNIDTVEGKQKIIIDLYDKFFKTAFPKMVERLGIVYTPVEVVDFIINSVEDVLRDEFNTSLSNKNVNILDPFTGTGTFIARLLQSGLIKTEDLKYKYENEIHANEIVLLAYYIASINIETVYHYLVNEGRYSEFKGMVLTDTFNMNENDDRLDSGLKENSARITKQKNIKIQVIMGNPPYSAGQKNENDNNKNIKYPKLDGNIADSYVKKSTAGLNTDLYDSYIRAIRWSSDRLKSEDMGVVAFVTNGSFIDGNAMDGLRKCLVEDFDKIYCFNLRGNFRNNKSKKEGENIFGNAAGTTIAITILVKNSNKDVGGDVSDRRKIYYYEIGDSLKTGEKLAKIKCYGSIKNIEFREIEPNSKGDWLNIRDNMEYEEGDNFIVLGDKKNKTVKDKGKVIFNNYSLGINTARDAWVYNFSKKKLKENMEAMIGFYNSEVGRLDIYCKDNKKERNKLTDKEVDNFIINDSTKISWTDLLKGDLKKFKMHGFKDGAIRTSMYRPFCKQYLYYGKDFNQRTYQLPKLMPTAMHKNMLIGVTGKGANRPFSALITRETIDYGVVHNAQWFGFYNYEYVGSGSGNLNSGNIGSAGDLLFGAGGGGSDGGIIDDGGGVLEGEYIGEYIRRDNISNSILNYFKEVYKDINITKEDIFYYVYGILNSKEYVDTYRDYIEKEIPKIPYVESFWEFSLLGKELANLHLNYEDLDEWRGDGFIESAIESGGENFYKVSKMKFLDKKTKDTIIYNENIMIKNIPQKAYEYKVNGKSAIEWVMDRYCFDIDKKTKIVNDCNLYDGEGGKYIYTLLLKIINLSISSVDIINNLPSLKIIKKDK